MFRIDPIINSDVVFTIIKRVWLLKRRVVGGGCVCVSDGETLHCCVHRSDCRTVRSYTDRLTVESQVRQIPTRNRLTSWNNSKSHRIDCRVTGRNVQCSATQAKVTEAFSASWHTSLHGRCILTDVFVFLTTKEEEFVFDDRPVEVPTKIIETKFSSLWRLGVSRIKFIVAQELISCAVIIVCTAARDHVDCGACVAPVLSREVGGLNLNFLDEVDTDVVYLAVIAARVHVGTAIDAEIVVVRPVSINRGLTNAQAGC